MVIPSEERISQSKYIFKKSIIYFTKNQTPRIPKVQGKYFQTMYLFKKMKRTYKTNKKTSVLKVNLINTLALCQIT